MPLTDSYGRQITYLRVSVTDRCNFRCRYCMPADGVSPQLRHADVLSYEESLRLIGRFVVLGINKVRITGGEPLIRKGLAGFVSRLSRISGIEDLSLTTHGALLAEQAAELKRAGLQRVNVSLDTLDPEKFRYITRIGDFAQVRKGLDAALEIGLVPLKINVVAIRGFNDEELAGIAALTVDKPVEVRFIELMPLGCASRLEGGTPLGAAEIIEKIEAVHGKLELEGFGSGPARTYRIAGACGRIGIIDPLSGTGFCARCNRLRLTAAGKLRPCLFSDESVDLLGPLRNGADDEALDELIREAVSRKPACHADSRSCKTVMNSIGG